MILDGFRKDFEGISEGVGKDIGLIFERGLKAFWKEVCQDLERGWEGFGEIAKDLRIILVNIINKISNSVPLVRKAFRVNGEDFLQDPENFRILEKILSANGKFLSHSRKEFSPRSGKFSGSWRKLFP